MGIKYLNFFNFEIKYALKIVLKVIMYKEITLPTHCPSLGSDNNNDPKVAGLKGVLHSSTNCFPLFLTIIILITCIS